MISRERKQNKGDTVGVFVRMSDDRHFLSDGSQYSYEDFKKQFPSFYETESENDDEGYVYFIRSQQNKVMKIGMAKDPFSRMRSIQTGHSDQLFMWATILSRKKNTLEKDLHEVFKKQKIRGEWFEYNHSTYEKIRWFCRTRNLEIQFHECMEVAMKDDFRILVQKNSYGPGIYLGLIINNVKVCHFVALNLNDFHNRLADLITHSGVDKHFPNSGENE